MKALSPKFIAFLIFTNIFCINLFSQEVIVQSGDSWDYFDEGYLQVNWAEKIDNIKWKQGKAPLGYGDDQVKTEVSFGGNEKDKEFIEYFKKEVDIQADRYFGYEFRLLRDDGAIVYVNGKELYRSNMQNTVVSKNIMPLRTISSDEETIFHVNVFDEKVFKEGKNTIAVAVYQSYRTSSDLIFDLELIGHNSSRVLEKLISSKDSENRELQYKLGELNYKFELEQLKNQNEILNYSNYTLKVFLFVICLLFIIAAVSLYYLLENNKQKSKKNKETIDAKNKECSLKDKELIHLSTKLLNNKQFFKELRADVKSISTTDKSTVKSIVSEIDTILTSDEEWDILKKHFSAVFSNFYDKLLQLHPELSESDLRHCMFIKLHMQTKEIARILLIDPRSVQTTRYRIKKKMNLDEDTDLREYLLKI